MQKAIVSIARGFGKVFSLLLIVILGLCIMAELATAQSIPKPSIPEVTVKLVRASYNVTSPSTGETRQIDNNTIEFKIKNQPVAAGNSDLAMFYLLQFKEHSKEYFAPIYSTATYHIQSNTAYTVLKMPLNGPNLLPPVNSTLIDFQVQAQIGHYSQTQKPGQIPGAPVQFQSSDGYTETRFDPIEKSDWSNTQTVNLNETVTSQDPASAVPEFPAIIVLALLGTATFAVAVEYRRKRLRNSVRMAESE